ncbi:recombination protein NinG, partial [Escherichia coli]|uniref:recombination protein NinG n=1 Tax=Escherichia coli TaxID=562 RepID=UPI000B25DB30
SFSGSLVSRISGAVHVPYRVELINRIGQEAVDEIESNHNRHRWTVEECRAIKAKYQQKLKDLRNSRSEAA